MNNLLETSLFAGVSISLVSYMIGLALKNLNWGYLIRY